MTLIEVIEKMVGSMSIVIKSEEGIELYKGYRGNYELEGYDEAEVVKLGFFNEIIPANPVNKKPFELIFQEITVKK